MCVLRKFISVLKKVITPRTEYGVQKMNILEKEKMRPKKSKKNLG